MVEQRLEILTDDYSDDPTARIIKEWLVIDSDETGRVSFRYEYQRRDEDWRNTWQDMGASVDREHLDEVIDALVRVRDATPKRSTER